MCFVLAVILIIILAVPATSMLNATFGVENVTAFFQLVQKAGAVFLVVIAILFVISLFNRK